MVPFNKESKQGPSPQNNDDNDDNDNNNNNNNKYKLPQNTIKIQDIVSTYTRGDVYGDPANLLCLFVRMY